MPIKLKKLFYTLFISYSDLVIKINFIEPIDYNKYYGITKIVSYALLEFQTARYLNSFSKEFIIIDETLEHNKEVVHEIWIKYEIFKKILLNIKHDLRLFHKNNYIKFVLIPECESINDHIESLVNMNEICKKMSIRQLNSSNNRKLTKLKEKLNNNITVATTKDAIEYIFNQLVKIVTLLDKKS